ncbi:MAG: LacI family DNA-binding transcriptional regulator [Oscillospiraceae bacterium]
MEDIARMAGVSKATVSRVVNNKAEGVGALTRQRVKAIIEDAEYKPDLLGRGIVTSKTHTIGIIVPDITNPFYSMLVKAIGDKLDESGYTLLLSSTGASFETEQKHLATFIAKRVDGIILTTSSNRIDEVRCMIFKYNLPLVLLDRTVANIANCPGVFIDNEYALFISTEYLIKRGHYKIAYVTGQPEVSTTQARVAGYLAAHKHYRIPFREELLVHGEYSYESGYAAVSDMLDRNVDFTALLCGCDTMAIGALTALKEHGKKVPEDIELIGFDNIQFSHIIEPSLTTVEQPVMELGREAAKMVLSLVNEEELETNTKRLEPRMVFRESTAQKQ